MSAQAQEGPSVAITDSASPTHMNSASGSNTNNGPLNDVNNLMDTENSDTFCESTVIKTLSKRKSFESLSPIVGYHNKKSIIDQSNIMQSSTKSSSPAMPTANIPTNNRYAALSDSAQPVSVKLNERKSTKIPPIITIDLNHSQIKSHMNSAKVKVFYIKYMSVGTKLIFENIEDYTNAKLTLKQNNVHFYSHDVPNEKTTKFVLSGLHDINENELKEALNEEKINAFEVKKMKSNKKATNDSFQYLIYFANNSNTKLSDLKTHKYVMGIVVRWSPYINSRNGPTQCSKCQLYGHGNKNCYLPPRCAYCGGQHETSLCEQETSSSTKISPKCCLCAGDHSSKDRSCPKRTEYMMLRTKSSSRQPAQNFNQHTPKGFSGSLSNTKEFPALVRKQQPEPINYWFAPPINTNSTQGRVQQRNSDGPLIQPIPPRATNPDLFSIDELLQLSHDLIESLSRCTSKQQQFKVVTDLTIKYLYNSNGY